MFINQKGGSTISPRTPSAYEQLRDDRRELILNAATKVFARKGLATSKIADVAAEAGISYGLVYHYFKTKDALFAVLTDQAADSLIGLTAMLGAQPGTPWERLALLVEVMVGGLRQQPELFMISLEALTRESAPAQSRERLTQSSLVLRSALKQLLQEGQSLGQVVAEPPDQLITAYLSCTHGLALTLLAEGDLPAHFPTAQQLLRLFKP